MRRRRQRITAAVIGLPQPWFILAASEPVSRATSMAPANSISMLRNGDEVSSVSMPFCKKCKNGKKPAAYR